MPEAEEHPPGKRPQLGQVMHEWQLPSLPRQFRMSRTKNDNVRFAFAKIGELAGSRLSSARNVHERAALELCLIDWLYETISLNVKRGRLFEIDRVLSQGEADCLGYALLFDRLAKRLGIDAGIVEVIIDYAGRPVSHVVNMVTLSDERTRFIDLWYGSTNIRHRRIALRVKQASRWRTLDANWPEIRRFRNIRGLPLQCVDAIAGYVTGNRHLERGIQHRDDAEVREAVRCYTQAIDLSPLNARMYFNRAIAYENLGDRQAAEADYAIALRDEASLIRVQARQHNEVVRLMVLDQMGLSARDKEMYLRRKGFVTGREVPLERIAARYHMPPDEANWIISRIEHRLLATASP